MDYLLEGESEKTELLFKLDIPFLLSSIPLEESQEIDQKSAKSLQQTFQTFHKTHSISLFDNPNSLCESQTIENISTLLSMHGYQELQVIGKGGFGLVFRAKSVSRNEIVALKLQISSMNESTIQEEANLGKLLSKKAAENLKSKTLSIYSKTLIKDPNEQYVLTIIEMELAKFSLREEINEKRKKGHSFSRREIKKIAFDLLENLCYIQLNGIAHFDIKPENILFINLNESYILADFGISEEIMSDQDHCVTFLKGSTYYMSPKMREALSNNQKICTHNPFKSDIYSLGLILLELNTVSILSEEEFFQVLRCDRGKVKELCEKFPLYLNYHYLFHDEEFYKYPNILSLMLDENEDLRKDILELCLIIDLQELLLTQILTPLCDRFLPNISPPSLELQEVLGSIGTKEIQILYTSRPVVYIGEFKKENAKNEMQIHYRKEGKGMLLKFEGNINEITKENYQKSIIYKGFWKDDLPHGFGTLNFNAMGTKYEGNFHLGRFHGQGNLFIRNNKVGNTFWIDNLAEEYKYSICVDFINSLLPGYYKYHCVSNKIFLKVVSQNQEENFIIFDLYDLGNNLEFLKGLLELLNNRFKFTSCVFKEKIENPLISKGRSFDQFSFEGKDSLFSGKKILLLIVLKPQSFFTKSSNKQKKTLGFLKCDLMSNIEILDFKNSSLQNEDFIEILSNKALQSLQTLKLEHNEKITDVLFSNNFIFEPTLLSLDFSFTKIGDETLRYLASKNGVKALQELNLSVCRNISNNGIKAIASSVNFKFLQKLILDSCLISDEAIEYIAKSTFLKNLTYLDLCHCSKLMDLGIRNLVASENVKNLTKFVLSYLHLTDISLKNIIASKFLGNLEFLDLTKSGKLSHEALGKLFLSANLSKNLKVLKLGKAKAASKNALQIQEMKNLRRLKLKKCSKITDEFFEIMANQKNPSKLENLSIGYTKITDRTLECLESSFFKNLKILKISGSYKIKVLALIKLFTNGQCKENLTYLDLSDTMTTDEFLFFLGKSKTSSFKLESLNLNFCKRISMKGIESLFASESPLKSSLKYLMLMSFEDFELSQNLLNSNLCRIDLKSSKIINFSSFNLLFDYPKRASFLEFDLRDVEFPKEIFRSKKKIFPSYQILTGSSSCVKSDHLISYLNKEVQIENTLSSSPKTNTEDVTDETLKSFSNSLCLKCLKELNLASCSKITDHGFCLIMNSPNCKNLEKIDLSSTNLSDSSLVSIETSPSAGNLQTLVLLGNENMTFKGIIGLLKSVKKIRLLKLDARIKTKPTNFSTVEEIFIKIAEVGSPLTHLFLDFSSIKCEETKGLYDLCKSLKKLENMQEFSLSFAYCGVNEEIIIGVIKAIMEGMRKIENLKLDFKSSIVKSKGCDEITNCLKGMSMLKKAEINLQNEIISSITRQKLKARINRSIQKMLNENKDITIKI